MLQEKSPWKGCFPSPGGGFAKGCRRMSSFSARLHLSPKTPKTGIFMSVGSLRKIQSTLTNP